MKAILLALVSTLKKIFLKIVSEKFFEWLFFWSAKSLVSSTKSTKDDEFLAKVEEIYYDEPERRPS